MPNQLPLKGSKDSSVGDSNIYPARDVREMHREGSVSQGDGRRSDREKIRKRHKGPGVCELCCRVCCGTARELVEYLSMKEVIDITSQVF